MSSEKIVAYTPPISPLTKPEPERYSIGVLTSGGDAPGMNCAIRSVVRESMARGCTCYFIKEGYFGLVTGLFEEATWSSVSNITNQGGSMIGSARCEEFKTKEGRKKATLNLFKHGVFHLIAIGGDGTLTGANILKEEWGTIVAELLASGAITAVQADAGKDLRIVGLVGSIDNDMIETDKSIGSDSALTRIVEAVDSIAATASSHQRTFVIEVMGRNCGYLALTSAMALEADYVFYPENPPNPDWPDVLCGRLEAMRKIGKRLNLVIICENCHDTTGNRIEAEAVKTQIELRLKYEVRTAHLGHLQRGGTPSFLDRLLGLRMGFEAVREILRSDIDSKADAKVLCLKGHAIVKCNMTSALNRTKRVAEVTRTGDYDIAAELRGRGFVCKQTFMKLISTPPVEDLSSTLKRLLIIHIGSPCAGMNSATMAFVRIAYYSHVSVYGVQGGWNGLKKKRFIDLTWASVTGWASQGGSALGVRKQLPTDLDEIAAAIDEKQVDGICIVGGFEAYMSAKILTENRTSFQAFNIPIVVVPASISNNVPGTCVALGSDTALNEICRQVDNIRQAAVGSHNKTMIIETMGGRCGYLTTLSALATGADGALIYQKPHDESEIRRLAQIAKQKTSTKSGEKYIMMRSEGASDIYTSADVKRLFDEELKATVACRLNILGYSQQGGSPSCFDRQMGARLGIRAFEGLFWPQKMGKRDCCVVGLRGRTIKFVPVSGLTEKVCTRHRVPLMLWWLDLHPLVEHLTYQNNEKA
ncbi:unnamed protein product [Caenorhabditis auriculariae]|uniref:6-phosphofructokinase n=1 Tax=Caenorhabditis auriculariae TaxID=2777116 RepID=A0A8S1GT52_9PELO|nr:unnamed protein product [Caenorhabditis auriculariae]